MLLGVFVEDIQDEACLYFNKRKGLSDILFSADYLMVSRQYERAI
jgi:hypothetical protein